ncbi:MAG: hypothetical protein ACD_39C01652G0004 [uncultured bacterium]|nr:MAG: hypothetical protein ACD_39C01652G0004 [uncultured bacterium]
MSVRPIDIKTNLMGNDEASRLREHQKAQEAGLAENLAQNKNAQTQKTEPVQKPDATEGKVVRKEDEESEKKQKSNPQQTAKAKDEKSEEEEIKHPLIPDGTRGLKIDIKI